MRYAIITVFYLVVIAWALMSCGPAAKIRRAERILAKAELQGAKWRIDTIYNTIEVPVPEIKHDTLFKMTTDTVKIFKDRLRMKYYMKHDTVYLEGECLPDTIKVTVPVEVTKTLQAKQGTPWWVWVLVACVFIVGLWMGAKLFRGGKADW